MKFSSIVALGLVAKSMAAPTEHQHQHQHVHVAKRDIVTTVVYVNAEGSTIANPSATSTASPTTVQTSTDSPTSASNAAPASSSASSGSGSSGAGGYQGDLGAFSNPSQEFQDGVHDCSSVPTGQGVISIDWISGLNGGWSSIMDEQGNTSPDCTDGFYCSYGCQAGMSKTQWPSNQPANGISVGGLQCKNGKLYKSNSNSNYLCEWGNNNANFVSEIGQDVAICRTDYPGSENMNIPTLLKAGSSAPVSVVDSGNYYTWKGGKTSTQYYVNNAGVSVQDGCVWGDSGSGNGNWGPVVLGAGTTDGNTYLSIIPNPNNESKPNFNIKIVGTDGANVVGDCKYENGQYNGGADGCTVTVTSGTAQFVFY